MKKKISLFLSLMLIASISFAQNTGGLTTGLDAARLSLSEYIDPIVRIIMVIGGIVGVIGAIRIYQKWQSGDHDINKEIVGWGGSAVFLVLAPIVVKAIFSL